MIGIVAIERRHIEGGRKARLALREQVFKALIRILSGTETGEHTHSPGPGAIHRRLDAACIGILTREANITHIVSICIILWHVDAANWYARGSDQVLTLRHAL